MGVLSKLAVKAALREMPKLAVKRGAQGELFPGYGAKHVAERFKTFMDGSAAVEPTHTSRVAPTVPKRLYHATKHDFDKFEIGRETVNDYGSLLGPIKTNRHAIFMAEDPRFSEEYIRSLYNNGLPYENGANIMPLHLSAKNPFDMREDSLSWFDENEAKRLADNHNISIDGLYRQNATKRWDNFDGDYGRDFVADLKRAGYDSAVLEEVAPELPNGDSGGLADVWAAFDPRQIKSAIGNRGSFDPRDPRIHKARGGRVSSFAVRR